MTENEMLEALNYIARRDDEMLLVTKQLHTLRAAITRALDHLEKAHRAVHSGDRIACLHHITDAMAALGVNARI